MLSDQKVQLGTIIAELLIFALFGYYSIKWVVKAMDPTRKAKEEAEKLAQRILAELGVHNVQLSDYEMSIATQLVNTSTLNIAWKDIGGLESTISDIFETVIIPFNNRRLLPKSALLCPPKGVLLYGPPGCGKTMIAKATAKEAGCRFINLEVSSLLDKWYGESQKLVNALFSLAYKIQPCLIFIDEIDSFLRSRHSQDHESTAMMKAQFMSLWDGLLSNNQANIIIMGATNRPHDVDKAILRRMPCRFHIGLPDAIQREAILRVIMANEQMDASVALSDLAECTSGFSGSDLREMCRLAAIQSLRELNNSLDDDEIECNFTGFDKLSLKMENFMFAIERMQRDNSTFNFS